MRKITQTLVNLLIITTLSLPTINAIGINTPRRISIHSNISYENPPLERIQRIDELLHRFNDWVISAVNILSSWKEVSIYDFFVDAQSPNVNFSAYPLIGFTPLGVQFSDESINVPIGWAWYFGDETFEQPWTQMTANAEWSAREYHTSVALPDGSIVLMGGYHDTDELDDVWRSIDKGATWTQMTANAEWSARKSHTSVVLPDGSIVLMGGYDGNYKNDVWRSTNMGATWTQMTASAEWSAREGHTSVVLSDGSIVLMGGGSDVWRSIDKGATWTQITADAEWSYCTGCEGVVLPDDSIVLIRGKWGEYNDVWRSTDKGASWTKMTSSAKWTPRYGYTSVALPDGSIVLIGGHDDAVKSDIWRSTDMGANWTQIIDNAEWSYCIDCASVVLPDGSVVLLGVNNDTNDVWRWETANTYEQDPLHTYSNPGIYSITLQAFDSYGSNRSTKPNYITVQGAPTIISTDHATFITNTDNSFKITTTGFPLPDITYTSTLPEGITFTDNGDGTATLSGSPLSGSGTYTLTFTASNGLGTDSTQEFDLSIVVQPLADFNGAPTVGLLPLPVQFSDESTGDPLSWAWYFGDEKNDQPWVKITNNAEWSKRDRHASVVLPDGSIVLMGGRFYFFHKNDVWRSIDKGTTWTQMTASAEWSVRENPTSVALPDGSIVLMGGSGNNDVWRSIDKGATWTQMTANAEWSARSGHASVALHDGSIVLMGGSGNNDVWRSIDKGATWTQMTANAEWSARSGHTCVVLSDGSIVLMGGSGNYDVWRSTDKGATWTQMTANAEWSERFYFRSVALPDDSIVVTGGFVNIHGEGVDDVWRSTDKGATWTQITASAGWCCKYNHSSVVLPDGSVVLMGGENWDASTNDVWRWETAGSYDQHPLHTYADPGIYTVTLQASNPYGYDKSSKPNYITVQSAPSFISADHVTFTTNSENTYIVATTGFPLPDLTYKGTLPEGVTFTDNGDGTANLSGNPLPGTTGFYSLSITANNGSTLSATQLFTLSINDKPIANAGPDQSVETKSFVILDGTSSSDIFGDLPLSYLWSQTGGTTVTLSNTNSATPTFTSPADPDTLTFSLVVTDSLGSSSAPDLVVITVNNQAPVANAGMDQSADTLTMVTLNGSLSIDPDGDTPLTYMWAQTGGTAVMLNDVTSVSPSFTTPAYRGNLRFSLVVTDSLGSSSNPDEVVITINNKPPIANAGEDQSVYTLTSVTLDGTLSSDIEGDIPLTYAWMQLGGTTVSLSSLTSANPEFTTPEDPGTLTFRLIVTDSLGASSIPDEVQVIVNNQAPFANAGENQLTYSLAQVSLDGSLSNDIDGDLPLSYHWIQINGENVELSNSSDAKPIFLAPSGSSTLVFSLSVTDQIGSVSDTDEVTITVFGISPGINEKLSTRYVTFDWEDIPGATKYKIQLSLKPDFSKLILNEKTTDSTLKYISALTDRKTFYWRVKPLISSQWRDWIEIWSFFSMNPPKSPILISPYYGLKTNDNTPTFTWNLVENGRRYQILISPSSTFSPLLINKILDIGTLTYTPDVLPDGIYYWRVRAYDSVGVKGTWSITSSFKVDTKPPSKPLLYKPLNNAQKFNTPTFSWYETTGAKKYVYEYGLTEHFITPFYRSVLLTNTYHKPPAQLPGVYYWRVRAIDSAGNESISDEWRIEILAP